MTESQLPELNGGATSPQLLTIDAVQKTLGRSRASVYRYANTDPVVLNPPYDPKLLNPEFRHHKDEPLSFHPNEVARFARDVLGQQVTVEFQPAPHSATETLLQAILTELQAIHHTLQQRGSPAGDRGGES